MPYKVYMIKPDGSEKAVEYPKVPQLKELQEMVGGLIETVPHLTKYNGHKRGTAYINEEGIRLNLPFNGKATKIWLDNLGKGPFRYKREIFGNMVYYAKIK